jgi:hypothetical protein
MDGWMEEFIPAGGLSPKGSSSIFYPLICLMEVSIEVLV